MKKIVSAILLGSLVSMSAYAEEVEAATEHSEEKSDFYIAVKALSTLGSSIDEENAAGESVTLKGSAGYGLGIDLGYEISHGFSVEVDGTYAANTVTETAANGDSEDFSAYYMTSSMDIAYRYMATEALGLMVKGGYEFEYEKIDTKDSATNSGFTYAAALTYEINEHVGVLGEYEVTTVEGPRGNSAFVGIEYSF